jgi:acyl carrier protein
MSDVHGGSARIEAASWTSRAPQGEIEAILAGIWQELLHVERVGRQDNFFELGGHSMTAMSLMQRVAERFAIQFYVQAVFRYATFWEMAQFIKDMLSDRQVEIREFLEHASLDLDAPILPRKAGSRVLLTARQRFMWNAVKASGSRRSLWTGKALRISGPLSIPLLQRSIDALVCRHEPLRTRFVEIDSVPIHHIDAVCEYSLDAVDLSGASHSNAEEEVRRICTEFFRAGADLSVGSLFAVKLFKLSDNEHVLMIGLDHMISDGESIEIVCRDIWELYRQATQEVSHSLPPLGAQFADYAVWQERTSAAWLKLHSAYWRWRLQGAYPTTLPGDDGLVAVAQPVGATLTVPFGRRLSFKLREAARRARTLPALIVLAIYAAVISRWCGQRDLVIKFPSNGRFRPELINMVGWISGPLYLRVEITEKDSLLDLLKKADLEFNSAYEHYDFNRVPELIPECTTEVSLNCAPRFLGASRYEGHPWEADDGVRIQPFLLGMPHAPTFLPFLHEDESQIVVMVKYRPDLFAPSTIERFGRDLRLFAQQFADDPFTRVMSIMTWRQETG